MAAVTGVPQSTWESIIARESNGDYTVANGSGHQVSSNNAKDGVQLQQLKIKFNQP